MKEKLKPIFAAVVGFVAGVTATLAVVHHNNQEKLIIKTSPEVRSMMQRPERAYVIQSAAQASAHAAAIELEKIDIAHPFLPPDQKFDVTGGIKIDLKQNDPFNLDFQSGPVH